MKRETNIIILLILICTGNVSIAQSIKFRKVIGSSGYDYGMSAKQTPDKGYIIGGSTSSFGAGNSDVYVVKTDSMGIPKIQNTFGGINIDIGTCIRRTNDNGYIITGYTNSFGAGGYDVYLVKMDSTLGFQWSKTYGGADWDFGNCVEQTLDNGYIICGTTYSYGKGDEDYYLIKTDSIGDTLWTKTFGGVYEDVAKSVIQTSDSGYILTGYTRSMGDSLGDFYTIKTDINGDTTWTNKFGGAQLDYGNDILESISGGYIVGGETKSFGAGNSDGIVIRISAAGITGPISTIGNTNDDNIQSITERPDGKIAMAGITNSYGYVNGKGDIYFFLANSDFSFSNSTTFGSLQYELVNSIETTNDKGAIICGSTNGFNNGLDDIYLIKTDSLGAFTTTDNIFITSIQTIKKDELAITITPNPSNECAYINLRDKSNKITVILFDVVGKQLSNKEYDNFSHTLSIPIITSDLSNGIYIVSIITDTLIHSEKIIVHHQ